MGPKARAPVSSNADLVRLLGASEPSLRDLGVRRLGLFGSFRRDRVTPDSDLDLRLLCEALCGRPVEIVTPNSLSPHIHRDIEYVLG